MFNLGNNFPNPLKNFKKPKEQPDEKKTPEQGKQDYTGLTSKTQDLINAWNNTDDEKDQFKIARQIESIFKTDPDFEKYFRESEEYKSFIEDNPNFETSWTGIDKAETDPELKEMLTELKNNIDHWLKDLEFISEDMRIQEIEKLKYTLLNYASIAMGGLVAIPLSVRMVLEEPTINGFISGGMLWVLGMFSLSAVKDLPPRGYHIASPGEQYAKDAQHRAEQNIKEIGDEIEKLKNKNYNE